MPGAGVIDRVVFVCRQIPEFGGAAIATERASILLQEAGFRVEHVSFRPGDRPVRFPTLVVHKLGDAHDRPSFRDAGRGLNKFAGVVLYMRKKMDRAIGRRQLLNYLTGLDSRTVVVFTNVLPKMWLDTMGFRRGFGSAFFVGQHHSSFEGAALNGETESIVRHFADVDLFLALTEADAQQFQTQLAVPVAWVPNAVPRLEATGQPSQDRCVALSRYATEKRLDLMIDAFDRASDTTALRHWTLHLYGEGSRRTDLQRLIDARGLNDRVFLEGHTDDVAKALSGAALNLLTSSFEGVPLSILEASSVGVPTVSFDVSPGVRELVTANTGALVRQDDVDAYVAALQSLMSDAAARRAKGRNARANVAVHASEAVTVRWVELIHRLGHAQ